MKISKPLFAALFSLLFPALAWAVVGVSALELQEAQDLVIPSGSSLGTLDDFSSFSLQSSAAVSGGFEANYEARFSDDPWISDSLPQMQVLVYAYSDQDSAHSTFDSIEAIYSLDGSKWDAISSDERSVTYLSEANSSADVFSTINSDYESLHFVHVNGNLLYQASLYLEDSDYPNEASVEAYEAALLNPENARSILENAVDTMSLGLSILFPPTSSELSAKSEISSLNLNDLYLIPNNGEIRFDLYVGDPEGAVGTVIDASGISTPDEGDVYVYVDDSGRLQAGIYAPDYDADCSPAAGWYRIESNNTLHPYEWNEVSLSYGVGGFILELNGQSVWCNLSQARSESDLYFGDYPKDSLDQSMVGYLNDLSFSYHLTSSGLVWDEVLEEQLFFDLSNEDPDYAIFEYLKEEGIFVGSNGMLYPDTVLNRAEMVKVILKSFDQAAAGSVSYSPFWDTPVEAWYMKYLLTAYNIGMVEGNPDGSFLPANDILRSEFYTMLLRMSGTSVNYDGQYRDVDEDDWYADAAAYADQMELITSSSFGASTQVTRREAAQALYTLLQ
jgi:hypothetical protein